MAYLKCVLCEQTAATVKVLPCLHLLCGRCITEYFEGHSKVTNIIPCPSCGFKVKVPKSGSEGLTTYTCSEPLTKINSLAGGDNCENNSSSVCDTQHKHSTTNGGIGDVKSSSDDLKAPEILEIDNRSTALHDVLIDGAEEGESDELDTSKNTKDYLMELLTTMKNSMTKKEQQVEQLDVLIKQLIGVREKAENELEKRAEHLCRMIHERKTKLQNEINNICNVQLEKYRADQEKSQKESDLFNDARSFTEHILKADDGAVIEELHNTVSDRLLELIHRYKSAVEIFSVKLGVPDRGKEELHLSKLFGQFLTGAINCGSAELISSFNIDLSWPSSLITTKLNDFVVVGKTGAFETSGKVMFCDSNGHLKGTHDYKDDTVPFDAVSLHDGSILVSDNHGSVTKFSLFGNVHDVWRNKFKGSGKMARTFNNDIVVTSSEDQCIYKYNLKGELLWRFPQADEPSVFEHPHGIAIDSQDNMIVADYQQNCIIWLDPRGKLLHKYEGRPGIPLRCPSAVCCDPFDNVLVADFTNDAVHLVSKQGDFLGYLLTKENDVSCPNFLTLGTDGHLFVGQYGGQIQVFRYLSCARQA